MRTTILRYLSRSQRFDSQAVLILFFLSICSGPLLAQSAASFQSISSAFDSYADKVVEEKVFVHTDKTAYLAGELMWLKIYNVDRRFNQPISLSKVAYVELLDSRNKQVLQLKIALDSGLGGGSLIIPASLPSGVYRLRSYTNWMKNFSEEAFFQTNITIFNASRPMPNAGSNAKPVYRVLLFPEGGNLVEGLESKLAYKIVDQFGNGISASGWIIADRKDTVKKMETGKFGMGNVPFTPAGGQSYIAVFNLPDGNTVTATVPTAYKQGFIMQVRESNDNQVAITVKSNLPAEKEVFVLVTSRLVLKYASALKLVNGEGIINISSTIAADGINTITIFDQNKNPVCERLYFKFPATSPAVTVKTDQAQFQSRKKINLSIQSGAKSAGHLSMSVYRLDSLQKNEQAGIKGYFWLQSELKGKIESPSFYFSNKADEVKPAMENLLLTQGWRRYEWKQILSGQQPSFVYEPEYHGIILTARVVDPRDGKPVSGIQTFAGAPGLYARFNVGRSNDSGYTKIEIPELYGTSEIVVQTNSVTGDSIYRVDLSSPYSEMYSGDSLPSIKVTAADTADIIEQHIATQVQYLYANDKLNRFDTLSIDTTTFYFKPDQQYLLDDYTRFTTMEEVLREYVKWLTVRKRDNNFLLTLYDEERKLILDNNPLVLLDGIPVFDLNKLMQYDPLKVRKLDVVHRRYSIGNYSYDGILNFVTYEGNLNQYPLDRNAVAVDYEGLQLKREFYSPDYETDQEVSASIPDFRTQLKWVNDIRLSPQQTLNLPLFSSDMKGRFLVVLQGLTDKGECLEAQTVFEVKGE
jgi:hypothetical protein